MFLKSLKHILGLQRKNTLYERAISDILLILLRKKFHNTLEYDLDDESLHWVFFRTEKYVSDRQ
jgi:hypothetical protein